MSGPRNIAVPRRGAIPPIGIDQIKPGNSLMVSPGNYGTFSTLQEAYDWLASSDRDAEMGALSATNRRTLILMAGKYTITSTLTLDTNFVDVTGMGEVELYCSTAGMAAYQTAQDVRLTGFGILGSNHNTSFGLVVKNELRGASATTTSAGSVYTLTLAGSGIGIAARSVNATSWPDKVYIWGGSTTPGWYTVKASSSDDAVTLTTDPTASAGDVLFSYCPNQSIYRDMRFDTLYLQANGGASSSTYGSMVSLGHLGGQWHKCSCGHDGFRTLPYAGGGADRDSAGALDESAATLNGDGTVTFAATSHTVLPRSSVTLSGLTNYKIVKGKVTATAAASFTIEHKETAETPGAGDTYTAYDSWMLAFMRDCYAKDYSYGGDFGACVAGDIRNCIGEEKCFGGCDSWGMPIDGYLRGCKAGTNSYAIATAIRANAVVEDCVAGENSFAGAAASGLAGVIHGIVRRCRSTGISGGLYTGSFGQKKSTNNAPWAGISGGLVEDCELGTQAEVLAGTLADRQPYNTFAGVCRRNHPSKPVSLTANITLREFDSGATINNTGDSNAIVITLPSAVIGLEYTIADTDATAAHDMTVTPAAADHFELVAGTVMANAESYLHTEDVYGSIHVKCMKANTWQVVTQIGTWAEATLP